LHRPIHARPWPPPGCKNLLDGRFLRDVAKQQLKMTIKQRLQIVSLKQQIVGIASL